MEKEEQQKEEQIEIKKSNEIYVHLFPFRAVLPYSHKYETFAKSRWYNKPLLETLVKEFKAYDESYYCKAIEEHRITINNKHVTIDYVIKNGDKLTHEAIREEPPILDLEIDIIEDNEDYLVVNKPPSFTVHTGGGFHYNTLLSVLNIEKGYKNLFVLHRLDRLTSGLIIFGKTKEKPQIFHKENESTEMKKMYFARVNGDFEWNEKTLCAEIECVSHKDGVYKVTRELVDKELEFEKNHELQEDQEKKKEELNQEPQKKKKNKNKEEHNPDLKESITHFKKVFYDKESDSSLLECYPISGRTHQIRVHLQFLGHPILNDVVYGGRFVGNNVIDIMKKIKSTELSKNELEESEEENYGKKKVKTENNKDLKTTIDKTENNKEENDQNDKRKEQIEKLKEVLKKEWDIETKPWEICLHSYQYTLEGRTYKTKKPYWAEKEFKFKV